MLRAPGTAPQATDARGKARSQQPNKGKGRDARNKVAKTEQGVEPKELRSTIRGLPQSAPPPAVAPPEKPAPDKPAPDKPAPGKAAASAAKPTTSTEPPAGFGDQSRGEFQRLLDEVETGFDAILVKGESEAPPPRQATNGDDDDNSVTAENAFDQSQARQLFHDLVIANAQPIRDFMIEVRLGEPHTAWIEHCTPAVRAILRSAEGMGFAELVEKVRGYIRALDYAGQAAGEDKGSSPARDRVVRGEPRERIIDAYSELIAFFPQAFALEQESNRREAAIVQALLSKVPGLFKLGVDRIYATGMASLGLFYVSRPKEIAELGGVSLEVAERIGERFSEHRKNVSETSPAFGRREERARLSQAVEQLARATKAYDASQPVTPERRVLRRERLLAMAEVNLLLARLGEVDRVKKLEPMAFAAKVEALTSYLDEAERKALAEQGVR